jgi:tetratricopeptide (TPR) repeat protein
VRDELTALKSELARLKTEQEQQVLARANSTVDFASSVIQWSAVFLTAFAIMVALAGFLGLREIQAIRKRSHEMEGLKEQFLAHLHNVEQLETRIDKQLRELADKFSRESQTFIEASYNFNTATFAYNEGDNQKAIEYYKRALALQPLNTRLFCRIGRAYTNLGEFQAAIESFQNALNSEPNYAEALRGMAAAYRYVDLDKSVEFARRAVDAAPTDYESLDYLGLLYRDKMQIDSAIDAHQRARKIRQRPETDFFLSLLYAKKRDIERAKLMMQSANVSLSDAQAHDRVRPLWAAVLRCGKAVIDEHPQELTAAANEVHRYVTTARIAETVLSHFTFLFDALRRQAELAAFLKAAVPANFLPPAHTSPAEPPPLEASHSGAGVEGLPQSSAAAQTGTASTSQVGETQKP